MKSSLLLILFLFFSSLAIGQSILEWSPGVQLTLQDFQSPQTEISKELSSYSIFTGTNMDFSFHMSTYEFMFTKNFNSEVKNTFNRSAAVVTAPDSAMALQMVQFGQYSFDLSELYCRKFRKELFEQKGAFSDPNFFQPIFSDLQIEMNNVHARVGKATDLGRNESLLKHEHEQVLAEIAVLSDFCRECKPPKKKKKVE
jgi:hypothetical protein